MWSYHMTDRALSLLCFDYGRQAGSFPTQWKPREDVEQKNVEIFCPQTKVGRIPFLNFLFSAS